MRRLILVVVLAAAVTLAVVGAAAAGDQMVPVKASMVEHVVVTAPPAPDCGLPNLLVSTGEMSHLGNIEVDFHLVHCGLVGPTQMLGTGTAEVIAANGDQLNSPSWVLQLDVVSGAFTFTSFDLVGGTGHFEHASGSLTGSGIFDLNPLSPTYLTGVYTVAGSITNVGSTK